MQLHEEAAVARVAVGVDPDQRRHGHVLTVDEDVQVLVGVELRALRT
jgi:hypothetical protein